MTLPDGARRLFPHVDRARLELGAHEPAIIERLLEDGDRSDLHWLTGSIPEPRLASWVRQRGARRLSRRSRTFWELVLGVTAEPRPPAAEPLWPL